LRNSFVDYIGAPAGYGHKYLFHLEPPMRFELPKHITRRGLRGFVGLP
jgi:hypothetical protein